MSFRVIRTEKFGNQKAQVLRIETDGGILNEGDSVSYKDSVSVVNKKCWFRHPYLCVVLTTVKGSSPNKEDILKKVVENSLKVVEEAVVEVVSIIKTKSFTIVRVSGSIPEMNRVYISSDQKLEIRFLELVSENPSTGGSLWLVDNDEVKKLMRFSLKNVEEDVKNTEKESENVHVHVKKQIVKEELVVEEPVAVDTDENIISDGNEEDQNSDDKASDDETPAEIESTDTQAKKPVKKKKTKKSDKKEEVSE